MTEGPQETITFMDVIEKWQKKRAYSDEHVHTTYFQLLNGINNAEGRHDWAEVDSLSRLSLVCIPGLVRASERAYGRFLITKIPALDHVFMFSMAKGEKGQILNVMDIVRALPALSPWAEEYEKLLPLKEVRPYILKNDGVLHTEVRKQFPELQAYRINQVIKYMSYAGLIEIQKSGKANRLVLTKK